VRARVVAHVGAAHGSPVTEAEVLAWIDGGRVADAAGSSLHWTLDPLDGTKGFLRREHYAVALALIADGQVLLGALGCPRLNAPDGSEGLLLTAARGEGTWAQPLFTREDATAVPVRVTEAHGETAGAVLRLCESVEPGHSDHAAAAAIAARLGITSAPLRLDSQAKYAAVAQGDAAVYLRMPTRVDYREKVWDHAAGLIIVEEAGGQVSDVHGVPLDFSRGRQLTGNRGVVATNRRIHAEVLAAVAGVLGRPS
jgi:3'(2'), 5'-bisphosphate nucleotidase